MESLRLISFFFQVLLGYKSRVWLFPAFRAFSFTAGNRTAELLKGHFLIGPALSRRLHFSPFGWTALCAASVPTHFICQAFCFEARLRWTRGTELELKQGLGPLVSRVSRRWANFENVKEAEVKQLRF